MYLTKAPQLKRGKISWSLESYLSCLFGIREDETLSTKIDYDSQLPQYKQLQCRSLLQVLDVCSNHLWIT